MSSRKLVVPSPLPVAIATKTESSRITSTSSTTAAPSRAIPSLLRSTPSSSRVWAEMLTLVAVSRRPMAIDSTSV